MDNLVYLKDVTTLELMEDKCTGCGMCQEVCPHGVMSVKDGLAVIAHRDACMECSACARNCPHGAIFVQSGVGCAQAVINSVLRRSSASCCNLDDYSSQGLVCGPVDAACGCEQMSKKPRRSGCC
jgi:NAD-dependent dihydropyrimidine dehydrogenase PreA subunit